MARARTQVWENTGWTQAGWWGGEEKVGERESNMSGPWDWAYGERSGEEEEGMDVA